ncbi:MAG: hypothetical protein ACR2P2_01220 [Nakamurella sp.]
MSRASSTPAAPSTGIPPYTKPGSTIAAGGSIVVPLSGTPKYVVARVSVASITKGTIADVASIEPASKLKGQTVWFVTYKLTNLGPKGSDMGGISLPSVNADNDTQGNPAGGLFGAPDIPKCKADAPDHLSVGSSVNLCQIALTGGGARIATVQYTDATGAVLKIPNTDYSTKSIEIKVK